ncbi:MAG: glycosyltransferase [Acidimicrobiia bacterium]
MRTNPPAAAPPFVWQHHDLFQRAGFTLARHYDCPLVLFVDAPIVWEASQWGTRRPGWARLLERRAERPQLREADLVACVSEEVADAVVSRGADPSGVVVAPCTADRIRAAQPLGTQREILGFADRVVVGWVGSFRAFHDAEAVVRSTAQLQQANPVALLMVGDGPTRQRCEELAAELGIAAAIFPGSVPHDRISEYLAAMDIAVIPSLDDTAFHYSPLKLKEYLAAGIAVVAPAIGEMERELSDRKDAMLYAAGDEGQMAAAIGGLVVDADLRTRVAQAGQATYDRLFTMGRQLDDVSARLGL